MSDRPTTAQIRMATGIPEHLVEPLREILGPLGSQLQRLPAEGFDAELSVKDGDPDRQHNKQQRVVLEVWSSGGVRLVATSHQPRLEAAVAEVRDDMRRQIRRHIDKTAARRRR